jgi:hypothetical protein
MSGAGLSPAAIELASGTSQFSVGWAWARYFISWVTFTVVAFATARYSGQFSFQSSV